MASDGSCSSRDSGWEIGFLPYSWLPWTSGTQTVLNHTVDVYADPIETIGHLDQIPFMGFLEARKGKLSFFTNFSIAGVDYSESAVVYRPRSTITTALGLDLQRMLLEMGIFYEVAKWKNGCKLTHLDFMAGVRYWHYDTAIKLEITDELDPRFLKYERDYAVAEETGVDWFDPLVGARIRRDLGGGKEWRVRGDIGGFGMGSDLTWNIATTCTFPVSICKKNMTSVLGYRILDCDYSQGVGEYRFESDLLVHGPIFGFVSTF